MRIISILALLLSASTALADVASSNQSLMASLDQFERGVPPSSNFSEVQTSLSKMRSDLRNLAVVLHENWVRKPQSCLRFESVAIRAAGEIEKDASVFSDFGYVLSAKNSKDALAAARLEILFSAIAELSALASAGVEGGYGLLDANQKTQCPFPNRAAVVSALEKSLGSLTKYFRNAFGVPSIDQMDKMEDRLLEIASSNSQTGNVHGWEMAGALTVASIALCGYAPAGVAVAVRLLWGYVPAFLTLPSVLLAIRTSAFAADGLVSNYLMSAGDNERASFSSLGSWDDLIAELESVLKAPRDAAEVYLPILTKLHAQLFANQLPQFIMMAGDLKGEPERLREIYIMNEINLLAGQPASEEVERLPQFIESGFGYKMSCSWLPFVSVNDFDCLLGMKHFARLLYSGEIDRIGEPASVQIADGWRPFDLGANQLSASVPFNAPAADLKVFFRGVYDSPPFRRRERIVSQVTSQESQLQSELPIGLEIDRDLSPANALTALMKLEALWQRSPELFKGRLEVIKLSRTPMAPYEEGLKIKVDLPADRTTDEMGRILEHDQKADMLGNRITYLQFLSLRSEADGLRKKLVDDARAKFVACSDQGDLTLESCVSALKRLDWFMRSRSKAPLLDAIVIAAKSETPKNYEFLLDPKTMERPLILRSDFTLPELSDFFGQKGWLKEGGRQ